MNKNEIFEWSDSLGLFPEYTGNTEEDNKRIRWELASCNLGYPLPETEDWIVPTIELSNPTKSNLQKKIPDALNRAANDFISDKAMLVLKDILKSSNSKLYPVKVTRASEMYYMVVPALYKEGKDMDIFALEGEPPYKKFVTRKFIDTVERNGLTGFCFQGSEGEAFYVNKNLTNKKDKATDKKSTSVPKSKDWLEKVEKLYSKQEWFELENLNNRIMQELVGHDDVICMMSFYDEALKLTATEKQYLRIKPSNMSGFHQKLSDAFLKAKEMAQKNETIKSIYCEYYYDGGDSCELNLFLSEKHPDEDESWASYFGEDGFIEGPSVTEFLNYDSEIDFKPVLEVAANQFIQAHFIRSCIDIIKEMKIDNIPVGFAEHDGMIVMLRK